MAAFSPALRYWTKGVYNRGFFVSGHALGMVYRFGGGSLSRTYSEGFLVGAGGSVGYSYELAPHWNLEAEVGLAGVWTRYDERYSAKQVRTADKSRVMVLPSRIGLSLAYVF